MDTQCQATALWIVKPNEDVFVILGEPITLHFDEPVGGCNIMERQGPVLVKIEGAASARRREIKPLRAECLHIGRIFLVGMDPVLHQPSRRTWRLLLRRVEFEHELLSADVLLTFPNPSVLVQIKLQYADWSRGVPNGDETE